MTTPKNNPAPAIDVGEGYRLLEVGEVILLGDQFARKGINDFDWPLNWKPAQDSINEKVSFGSAYRRKLPPTGEKEKQCTCQRIGVLFGGGYVLTDCPVHGTGLAPDQPKCTCTFGRHPLMSASEPDRLIRDSGCPRHSQPKPEPKGGDEPCPTTLQSTANTLSIEPLHNQPKSEGSNAGAESPNPSAAGKMWLLDSRPIGSKEFAKQVVDVFKEQGIEAVVHENNGWFYAAPPEPSAPAESVTLDEHCGQPPGTFAQFVKDSQSEEAAREQEIQDRIRTASSEDAVGKAAEVLYNRMLLGLDEEEFDRGFIPIITESMSGLVASQQEDAGKKALKYAWEADVLENELKQARQQIASQQEEIERLDHAIISILADSSRLLIEIDQLRQQLTNSQSARSNDSRRHTLKQAESLTRIKYLEEQLAERENACQAKDDALEKVRPVANGYFKSSSEIREIIDSALSPTAGQGYRSPEEMTSIMDLLSEGSKQVGWTDETYDRSSFPTAFASKCRKLLKELEDNQ